MNVQVGKLSELVGAVVSGASMEDAAKAAGMSISTAQRRLRDPEVTDQIAQARRDLTMEAVGRIRSLRRTALALLEEIVNDDDTPRSTSLKAIELILRHATAADSESRDIELGELEASVEEIKARLSEGEVDNASRVTPDGAQ